MDTKTPEQRSRNMAAVKNKNTGLEIKLRKALWQAGLRYRLNYKLEGKPDLVFPSKKVAVFCDGCFWHGCPTCGTIPRQNRDFWMSKLQKNKDRDKHITEKLSEMGWKVKRYWGCQIKKQLDWVVDDILSALK